MCVCVWSVTPLSDAWVDCVPGVMLLFRTESNCTCVFLFFMFSFRVDLAVPAREVSLVHVSSLVT